MSEISAEAISAVMRAMVARRWAGMSKAERYEATRRMREARARKRAAKAAEKGAE